MSVSGRTQSVKPFKHGRQGRKQVYWPRRQVHLSIVVNNIVEVPLRSVRVTEYLTGLARAYFVKVVHVIRRKYPLDVVRFVERGPLFCPSSPHLYRVH